MHSERRIGKYDKQFWYSHSRISKLFLHYRKLSIPEVRAAYQWGPKNGRNVSDVNSYKPHKYCTKTVEK